MSATLEQVNMLSREYDLAENEYQRALDAMRRYVNTLHVKIKYKDMCISAIAIFTAFSLENTVIYL